MKISTAIKKGNLEQVTGDIIQFRNGKMCGCAVGSAIAGVIGKRKLKHLALNLPLDSDDPECLIPNGGALLRKFKEVFNLTEEQKDELFAKIYQMNDQERLTLDQIVERLREEGL